MQHAGPAKPRNRVEGFIIHDLTQRNYTSVIIPNALSITVVERRGKLRIMAKGEYTSAPEDWFVDPVRLGIPGLRRPDDELDDPLAWQSDSLCAQTDPEAFFPEKGGSTRDAKKICASCEVRAKCLDYALHNDERFGIWGGLSERERRKLRKRA
jgi:WhiB family transcriptional regulator, redox-sensing transcriptional regulator